MPIAARRARIAAVAALAALALGATGCGSDDADEGGDGDIASADGSPFERDACELLTDADVEEILGQPVEGEFTPGDEETSTPGRCEWAAPQGGGASEGPVRPAAIQVLLGDEQIFENTRVLAENGDHYETLDDLGDDAYAGAGEGGLLIGGTGIIVTPIGVNVNDPATQELLVDAVSRVAENY